MPNSSPRRGMVESLDTGIPTAIVPSFRPEPVKHRNLSKSGISTVPRIATKNKFPAHLATGQNRSEAYK